MDRLNWEDVLPEVSEEFHNKVEATLEIISVEKIRIKKHMSKKARVLLVAAAIIVIGSATVSAASLFKWNQQVAKTFEANEELQNDLILKGVTEQKTASVTDNGLTINLIQTLQDKDYIYIALEVTAPKYIKLGDTNLFEENIISFDGTGVYEATSSTSSGFVAQKEGEILTNTRMYVYWIHKAPGIDLNGKNITLSLKNLQADARKLDMYTILEGNWDLSWIMNYNDSTKYYELNRNYNLSGYDVFVDRVEVSPLSMTIYYKYADIKNMEKAEGVNFDQLDTLKPIQLFGLKNKNGTTIQMWGNGGGEGLDKKTGEYFYTTLFEKVVNVDDLEGILLGKASSEISLIKSK